MTNSLKLAVLTLLAISLASEAQAALQLTSASVDKSGINGIGNDFSSQIASELGTTDNNVDIYKGSIQATTAGTVSFFVIASESGFKNGFLLGSNPASPSASWWETAAGAGSDKPWGAPLLMGSLNVAQGQLLDSLMWFGTEGGNSPNPIPAGNFSLPSGQFGIFLKRGTAGDDFSTMLFGFDDNGANLDDNHDDLIIQAIFEPAPASVDVPEPASLAVWGILLGSAGIVMLRNRRKFAA